MMTILILVTFAAATPLVEALPMRAHAAQVNARDQQVDAGSGSALIHAAQSGDTATVRRLLAAGANPNDTAADRQSALDVAVFRGDVALVKALLESGANPNLTQSKGNGGTPLIVATRSLDIEVMRALLNGGAKADAALPNGLSALAIAAGAPTGEKARKPADEVLAAVQLLLDRGANVKHVAASGDTALHAAAAANRPAVIELLVQRGAQVNVKNKTGQTPLALTLPRTSDGRGGGFPGYPEAEAILRKFGATQ
jgi:ankyrin repeat protein